MRNLWKNFWPYIVVIFLWVVAAVLVCGCDRALKKEIELLREELARQQQYVPLQRDTLRDGKEVITQKITEVERVKEVLTEEDRDLLKDLNMKVSALESYQKMSTETTAKVTLNADSTERNDGSPAPPTDSILTYKDAWLDLRYNTLSRGLSLSLRDSLAIAVEKEYKKKFLWWRWGTKGYQVKALSFNPYTSIKYNTYVKKRK